MSCKKLSRKLVGQVHADDVVMSDDVQIYGIAIGCTLFGHMLKKHIAQLKKAGLKRSEIAKGLACSPSKLKRIENGLQRPFGHAITLSFFLGLTAEQHRLAYGSRKKAINAVKLLLLFRQYSENAFDLIDVIEVSEND